MSRVKKWTKYQDVQHYIEQLEDVYGCKVDLQFIPSSSEVGEERSRAIATAYWQGVEEGVAATVQAQAEVKRYPREVFIQNVTRLLTDLTYLCIEHYVQASTHRVRPPQG
jgi:hypothetical protein